ncbi:hypothetical protein FACS1894184_20970 [Clostridia bacterium]|nr:hypothetical protein FACS1894184_20970 [Clostridia bacterium]
MTCAICGGETHDKTVPHMVNLGSGVLVIKNVPGAVCAGCGNVWFTGAVVMRLEEITKQVENAAITEVAVVNYAA